METYYVVLGTAGLILTVIDARMICEFKMCLYCVADSLSLILLFLIDVRVTLRALVFTCFSASRSMFLAWKRMGGQREYKSDVKSKCASGISTSGFIQFVCRSSETVNELGQSICRLIGGVLSLCAATFHLLQGALYLVTGILQFSSKSAYCVYALSCCAFDRIVFRYVALFVILRFSFFLLNRSRPDKSVLNIGMDPHSGNG